MTGSQRKMGSGDREKTNNPLETNTLLAYPVAFVVAVRLVLEGISITFSSVIESLNGWLPNTEGATFPRLNRFVSWFASQAVSRLPEWAEHRDGMTICLKTNAGSERLESFVNSIPDTLLNGWLRFSVTMMVAFLVGWGVILSSWMGVTAAAAWYLILDGVEWAITLDWPPSFEMQAAQPSFDPAEAMLQIVHSLPEMVPALGGLVIAFLAFIGLWWLFMLLLLPEMVLHELGHYAAIRKAGVSVESYGLLLYGPLPMGAFVEPGDGVKESDLKCQFSFWSAGIANSLLWGTAVLSCWIVLSNDPTAILQVPATGRVDFFTSHPLESVLFVIGLAGPLNAFLNALPVGPVDGGGFIRTAEEEWWGIEKSDGFVENATRFLKGDG